MRFEKLSDELVEIFVSSSAIAVHADAGSKKQAVAMCCYGKFLSRLQYGLVWCNGLMGSITFRYVDGSFEREMQDLREPEIGPFIHTYTEPEFREMLREMGFQYYAYNSLVELLKSDPPKS